MLILLTKEKDANKLTASVQNTATHPDMVTIKHIFSLIMQKLAQDITKQLIIIRTYHKTIKPYYL